MKTSNLSGPTLNLGMSFALVLALVALQLAPSSLAKDWSMGRADATGAAATADALPDKIDLLWELEIEGLGFDAGPIIADGKVFANDHDGRLLAIDLATGEEVWRKEYEAGFVATPSYKDGLLFAADYEGVLHAIEVETAEEKWSFESGAEVTGSPVFYEESVVFTSQSGSLFRLDRKSGKEVWRYETDEPILCGASLAGDITFLGGCDEQLHVVDLKTGKRIGEPITIGPTQSTPCAVADGVLIPTQGGEIYHFAVGKEGHNLEKRWTFNDRKMASEFRSSLAVADGIVIATGSSKRVFAVDLKTGEVLWHNILRRRASASPIIVAGTAIAATTDGNIYQYDLKSGKELWQTQLKGSFLGAPAAADGKLVLLNDRGTIFCFGEKS